MELFESRTHSYVIKIWLEKESEDGKLATWRGRITHVPDGKEAYFLKLYDIPHFILPDLQTMGVKLPWRCRLKLWLKRTGRSRR